MRLQFPLSGERRLLFAFLRSRWRSAALVFLLDFFANGCVIVLSLLLAQAVAVQFGFHSLRGRLFGVAAAQASVWLGWLAGVVVVKLLLDYARHLLRGHLSEDFAHELRGLVFAKHLNDDLRRHEQRDVGKNLLRFSGDLGSAQRLLARGVLQYAADWTLLLLGLALVAWLDTRLALFVSSTVALAWLLTHQINRRLRRVEERRRSKKAGLLAFVSATLQQLPGIQALNRTTRTTQRFHRKAQQVRDWGYRYHRWAAASEAFSLFFVQILLLVALVFGGLWDLPGSALFAVVLVLMSWRSALSRLLRAGQIWKKGLLSLEKIEALLHSPAEQNGKVVLEKKRASTLRLQGVALRFGEKTLFENLDFELELGKTLCLSLPTGGGKTALAKLLAGLYRPDTGAMELNGQPTENLTAHSLRRQIAFVSDAFPLAGRTLLDALSPSGQAESLKDTEATLREWQTLFPALQHLDFHQKMHGRAPGISAGQQRILQCFRAILADKPFLVLDEPFAGLDADTARALADFFQKNCASKGVLLLTTDVCAGARFWQIST